MRPSILRALAELQFNKPSEIQALLIPRALAGVDLLGQARTGTGKTAAFAIPVLQRAVRGVATQAIILVPTRELAVQVDAEVKRLAQHTPIRTVAVYGGQKIAAQMKFLRHHPEVIIGTPGRVIDLLDRRIIQFENIRFVVLDEVDRMLDIGFRDDIRNILSRIKSVRRDLARADARDEAERHQRSGSHASEQDGEGSYDDAHAQNAYDDDARSDNGASDDGGEGYDDPDAHPRDEHEHDSGGGRRTTVEADDWGNPGEGRGAAPVTDAGGAPAHPPPTETRRRARGTRRFLSRRRSATRSSGSPAGTCASR